MPTKPTSVAIRSGLACGAAILIAGVVSLSRSGKEAAPTPPSSDWPRPHAPESETITICALRDHSFGVALRLLRESDFEEKTGVRVKAVLLEFEPMLRAHALSFSARDGNYDLVSIDQPSLGRYVTEGWVRPLDEYVGDPSLAPLGLADVVPILRQSCGEWQGKLYAVPLGSYGALLAYRQDVLSSAGLTPPATFAEFLSHARAVNAPPDLYGTALFAHVGEYITADAAPFLWSWGAGLINGCDVNLPECPPYRVAWDTPEGIAALEFYARLYREGLAPRGTLEFDHARYIGAFQSGSIAMGMMPAEGFGAPMENPAVSRVVGKIAYANLPRRRREDGTLSPPRPGLGAHSLAISRDARHPRLAYLVLQFLTGRAIGADYIRLGGRPFRESHFSQEAFAQFPYMRAIQEGMRTGRCRPNIPEYPAVSEVFSTAFHSALQHDAPVGEVMRAAARKANETILCPAYPRPASRGPAE
jgi:multiple sugar transport system substrate-binding protein